MVELSDFIQRRPNPNIFRKPFVDDKGIDLSRNAFGVRGSHCFERPKVLVNGKLFLKSDLIEQQRAETRRRIEEAKAIAKEVAERCRTIDEQKLQSFTQSGAYAFKMKEVKEAACEHFNITMNDLVSDRRYHPLVFWRQITMAICKELSCRSLPEIGRQFGGRDHTTVLWAIRKIDRLLAENNQEAIQHIKAIKVRLMGK